MCFIVYEINTVRRPAFFSRARPADPAEWSRRLSVWPIHVARVGLASIVQRRRQYTEALFRVAVVDIDVCETITS